METLELFAKISLNAHLLGGAKEIPKEQIDKLLYLRDNYYHVTGKHPDISIIIRRDCYNSRRITLN